MTNPARLSSLLIGLLILLPAIVGNAQDSKDKPANLNFVNGDEDMIFIVRPAMLAKEKSVKKSIGSDNIKKVIEGQSRRTMRLAGAKVVDIDQITFSTDFEGTNSIMVIQTAKSEGFDAIIKKASEKEFEGFRYYRAGRRVEGMTFFHVADERTIIWSVDEESIRSVRNRPKKNGGKRAKWNVTWRNFETDRIVFIYGDKLFSALEEAEMPNPYGELIKPMLTSDYLIGSLAIEEKIKLFGELQLPNNENAKEVKGVVDELGKLGKIMLGQIPEDQVGENERAQIKLAKSVLNSYKLNVEGDRVIGSVALEVDMEEIGAMLGSFFGAAARTQSMNNIRQLGLAMHNYHDAYGSLPPSVIVHESGHRHSWRIAILPFIGERKLYNEYRMNEAWDSPHNAKVTERIPEFFKHPNADPESLETNYFAVVGDGAVFDGDDGTKLSQVGDGTSRTVLLVEGKKKTHWAKPEDIPFDPKQLRGALGGFSENGTCVLFCDCHVQFLSNNVTAEDWYKLITINGREIVDMTKLEQRDGGR